LLVFNILETAQFYRKTKKKKRHLENDDNCSLPELSKIMFEIWQTFYVHVVRNLVYILYKMKQADLM
jgi:hypothetical protein